MVLLGLDMGSAARFFAFFLVVAGCGGHMSAQSLPAQGLSESLKGDSAPQIRAVVRPHVLSPRNPGLVVGIFKDGSRAVLGYGKVSANSDKSPDGSTLFEIGSITKVFTAMLLAEMAEAGLVDLNDPLHQLLPESVQVPTYQGKQITLVQLATHTSGLPRIPGNMVLQALIYLGNPYAVYSGEDLYGFLSNYKLRRAPGQRYEYSNLGMGLLGYALSLKCGMTYEQAVVERICDRWGMDDTRVMLSDEQKGRLAVGHSSSGFPVSYWDFRALAGAGALYSTPDDMLIFLSANLGYCNGRLAKIISSCHTVRVGAGHKDVEVALAWHVNRLGQDGKRVLWHNGGTGGFRSWIGFVKETRTGVVILSNSANSVDSLGFRILRLVDELNSPER